MSVTPDFEWNDTTMSRLRALWKEGLSTNEIAKRMGTSKNSIVGKAHRLDLPPRPSPIRRDVDVSRRQRGPRRVRGESLPQLVALAVPVRVRPAPTPPPVLAVKFLRDLPVWARKISPCCWPIGEPRTPGFRFCDMDTLPGKQYCGEHCEKAFVHIPRKLSAA